MRFLGFLLAAMTAAAQVPSTFDNCPPVVQEVLTSLREKYNLAGVQFALAQGNGNLVCGASLGYADAATQRPMTPVTLMRIASVLIDFRRREFQRNGQSIRELRHNYLDRLNNQVQVLLTLSRQRDVIEANRQFQQEIQDDLAHLRQELRLEAGQLLGSKEMVTSFAGAAALVANFTLAVGPIGELASFASPVIVIGGLLGARSKFYNARKAVLKRHPMAYLYELKGGLKL